MKHVLNTFQDNTNAFGIKFLFIICLFISSNVFSQEVESNGNAGILSFDNEEIDFGTINQNDNGVRTFKFTNTGSSPIVITNVKTSCGCTVPTYSKEPIMAGASGEIEIKYDTNRLGVFTKTITIISNANEDNKILKIKGEVIKKTI